jgi:hypothetical protein
VHNTAANKVACRNWKSGTGAQQRQVSCWGQTDLQWKLGKEAEHMPGLYAVAWTAWRVTAAEALDERHRTKPARPRGRCRDGKASALHLETVSCALAFGNSSSRPGDMLRQSMHASTRCLPGRCAVFWSAIAQQTRTGPDRPWLRLDRKLSRCIVYLYML